jgi:hypothetical protein
MRKKRMLMMLLLSILSCDSALLESHTVAIDTMTDFEVADFMTMPPDVGYCQPEMWVCHNPGSKLHNQACTAECMVAGERGAYCWLKESECTLK